MALIKITNAEEEVVEVQGNISFEANQEGEDINIIGVLSTHKYFEEIIKIESHRYVLENVEVYKEVFGSNDFNILYKFKAENFFVKGFDTNLDLSLIANIEQKMYEDNDSNKWEGKE